MKTLFIGWGIAIVSNLIILRACVYLGVKFNPFMVGFLTGVVGMIIAIILENNNLIK